MIVEIAKISKGTLYWFTLKREINETL